MAVSSTPSPRLRGEGRGEGRFFEFRQEPLEDPVEILDDVVVPDADHVIPEGAERAVALLVYDAFCVLAAVELDYQAPVAADKVHVVPIDGLLADKFEATELSSANASPQREFGRRERPPQ